MVGILKRFNSCSSPFSLVNYLFLPFFLFHSFFLNFVPKQYLVRGNLGHAQKRTQSFLVKQKPSRSARCWSGRQTRAPRRPSSKATSTTWRLVFSSTRHLFLFTVIFFKLMFVARKHAVAVLALTGLGMFPRCLSRWVFLAMHHVAWNSNFFFNISLVHDACFLESLAQDSKFASISFVCCLFSALSCRTFVFCIAFRVVAARCPPATESGTEPDSLEPHVERSKSARFPRDGEFLILYTSLCLLKVKHFLKSFRNAFCLKKSSLF